jgi:hypothetical protein
MALKTVYLILITLRPSPPLTSGRVKPYNTSIVMEPIISIMWRMYRLEEEREEML